MIERVRHAKHQQLSCMELSGQDWDDAAGILMCFGRDMRDELIKRSFTWSGVRFDSAGQDDHVRCLVAAEIV